jgi:NAD(P)-dependent dehydrogenase (short-subunit alcohol dehydrogenase family)
MKILLIGANGTIGQSVKDELSLRHHVISAGRSAGDLKVDITDAKSIEEMFREIDNIDALVCTAGAAKWGKFEDLSEEDFYLGIGSKLMGQVNLVRIGKDYLNENGSFTLITGILADDPVMGTVPAAMVNSGLHGFVLAASRELKRGLRINVVAPGLVENSVERIGHLFPGHKAVSMKDTARGFCRSVEGNVTGEVIRIY